MYSRTNSINVKAKTMDEALSKAAKVLGVKKRLVCYEESEQGFLSSLFGSKVTINAWIKQPDEKSQRSKNRGDRNSGNFKKKRQKEQESKKTLRSKNQEDGDSEGGRSHKRKSRNRDDSKPRRSRRRQSSPQRSRERVRIGTEPLENEPAVIAELQTYCLEIAKFVDAETTSVETKREEDRCIFNIKSDYLKEVLTKNLKTAESFEHLLRKKPRHLKQDLPFRIFVDADNLRISRENELIEMANDLSSKVQESGRPVVLNQRSAYDRKIIHMALDKDEGVYTKSVGMGSDRRLMILPAGVEDTEGSEYAES